MSSKAIELMSDRRQGQIVKAAEDCIGLINVGVDPTAALVKTAEDHFLNDHETILVSHAVNNAKQLAHLQTSSADDKEKPFPLTNADEALNLRAGQKEVEPTSTKAEVKQPMAPQIQERVEKEAAEKSWIETGDYRRRVSSDTAAQLKTAWALTPAPELAAFVDPNPFAKISSYQIGIEEARLRATSARDQAAALLTKVAAQFQRVVAPSWSDFEKAAQAEGVTQALIDVIYETSGCTQTRHDPATKLARIYISRDVGNLVQSCVRADTLWESAADASAAAAVLAEKYAAAQEKLGGEGGSGSFSSWAMSPNQAVNISLKGDGLGDMLASSPKDYLGLGENPGGTLNDLAGSTKPEGYAPEAGVPQQTRQELKNLDSRAEFESLMQDPYIGGHSVPEVIDAYNAAASVNPNFGKAEKVAYMRHHLSTKGAVPLDLQIRASKSHGGGGEG